MNQPTNSYAPLPGMNAGGHVIDPDAYIYPNIAAPPSQLTPAPVFAPLPPATGNRFNWPRIIILVAALGALGYAAFEATSSSTGSSARSATPRANSAMDASPAAGLTPAPHASRPAAAHKAHRGATKAGKHGQAGNTRLLSARSSTLPLTRSAASRSHGGGVGPNGLPYTGAPTWLAALAGMLLLLTGLTMSRRAENIGEFAGTHQRGPLLRVDTWREMASNVRQSWNDALDA